MAIIRKHEIINRKQFDSSQKRELEKKKNSILSRFHARDSRLDWEKEESIGRCRVARWRGTRKNLRSRRGSVRELRWLRIGISEGALRRRSRDNKKSRASKRFLIAEEKE